MSLNELSPNEREADLGFEVTVHEDGSIVHSARFDTLAEAERFAENWSERVPGAHCDIEDRTGDHTAFEDVEADTSVGDDYPRDELVEPPE